MDAQQIANIVPSIIQPTTLKAFDTQIKHCPFKSHQHQGYFYIPVMNIKFG